MGHPIGFGWLSDERYHNDGPERMKFKHQPAGMSKDTRFFDRSQGRTMRRILLHTCCANCAVFPLKRFEELQAEVFGFFYNPNIHPFQEYRRRLETVESFFRSRSVKLIVQDEYDLEGFLRGVVFREEDRCAYCYHRRLEVAARMAKKGEFDAFTTTLLQSKHQNHDMIKQTGDALGRRFGIPFYYEDFRLGWKEGIEESKKIGLYRQHYCGCIYSEKERYLGKGRRQTKTPTT